MGQENRIKGKTAIITGASRGIGRAIALRLARAGANVVLASKTIKPHPRLPGTLLSVEKEVNALGGNALVHQVDVRFEDAMQEMVDTAAAHFGGIDMMINNAGAISLTDLESTSMKKFDLMHAVNFRAAYLGAKCALPYLKKSDHAHVLSMSPPLALKPSWLANHVAYTISKFNMSLMTLGLSEELKNDNIAVNSLWPRTTIWTAAVGMLMGDDGKPQCRSPEIMADATYAIVNHAPAELTGQLLLDDDILKQTGVTDFEPYAMEPGRELMLDLYVEG